MYGIEEKQNAGASKLQTLTVSADLQQNKYSDNGGNPNLKAFWSPEISERKQFLMCVPINMLLMLFPLLFYRHYSVT